jgi:hypothetical protein
MADTIEIRGLDEVLKRLKNVRDLTGVKAALKAGALHVQGKINKYPPETAANDSSLPRWYERNYGPRWRRKDGSVGGRKTSQMLSKSWTIESRDYRDGRHLRPIRARRRPSSGVPQGTRLEDSPDCGGRRKRRSC